MQPLFEKSNGKIKCLVCPHFCKLAVGKTGICGVRKNIGERIELLTYGVVTGFSLDPVEKKPLYHFFPGNNVLSIGSYGCNMRCDFCQNYNISQNVANNLVPDITPEEIVKNASGANKNIGIAFTYNEPVIWFEFVRDVALPIKHAGLFTVMVTNGFVSKEIMEEFLQFIDAFNVDLKSFNAGFYKKVTGAEIEPVKNALKQILKAGKHLEITTLVIPGQNDNETEMEGQVKWIAEELGKNVPLHLSRYFPMYKRNDPTTPHSTLKKLFEIALRHLDHVYMGNTMSDIGQNTTCQNCGTIVTQRSGYYTHLLNLTKDGKCEKCGTAVYKYFNFTAFSS